MTRFSSPEEPISPVQSRPPLSLARAAIVSSRRGYHVGKPARCCIEGAVSNTQNHEPFRTGHEMGLEFLGAQLIMSDNNNSRLLVIGAWFGLVAGLVEGLGLLAVFGYGWLTPNILIAGVTAPIIWISALVNLGLFLLLALCGMLVQKLLPRVE